MLIVHILYSLLYFSVVDSQLYAVANSNLHTIVDSNLHTIVDSNLYTIVDSNLYTIVDSNLYSYDIVINAIQLYTYDNYAYIYWKSSDRECYANILTHNLYDNIDYNNINDVQKSDITDEYYLYDPDKDDKISPILLNNICDNVIFPNLHLKHLYSKNVNICAAYYGCHHNIICGENTVKHVTNLELYTQTMYFQDIFVKSATYYHLSSLIDLQLVIFLIAVNIVLLYIV